MTAAFVVALLLLVSPIVVIAYASVVYPLLLWIIARRDSGATASTESDYNWPSITITVPAHNEEASIARTLEQLLQLDYPAHLCQLLVISDASSDNTDLIVREFSGRGVELLRLPERRGKTAAENLAFSHARGDVIVNIDASVLIEPHALKPLVRSFADPTVGVASGRDISIGQVTAESNKGEAGYVGYEMWVRRLETRVHSIVGASGCFFAIRRQLFDANFPEELSRDFASALIAREQGYRSVSVEDAVCLVPRSRSLRAEYSRKVRTMARGLATLEFKRHLLDPSEFGIFAWMLASHKLARWLFYAALPFALTGAIWLAFQHWFFAAALFLGVLVALLGVVALLWPEGRKLPRPLAIAGYALTSNVAGVVAWWKFLSGERQATWEPTRRG